MTSDAEAVRRQASHWFVRLREEEDPAVKAEFTRWLRADPAHAEAWRSMRETMEIIARAPAGWQSCTVPGQPRHDARIHRIGRLPSPHKRPVALAFAAMAATLAFVMIMPTVRLHLEADHATGAGQVEQVRLADGSTIRVGPDSAIAVDYDDGARTVRLLSGQAMFDVARDETRPFRVEAGNLVTTVLGTSFDVKMRSSATSIVVAHGHVRVEDKGATPTIRQELLAGDVIHIDAAHGVDTGKITPQLVGGWSRGEVLAENQSIDTLIDEIRPWFSGRIFVTDTALASRRVTGIYDVRNPEGALSMIVRPYGGRVTQITPWILIVSGG